MRQDVSEIERNEELHFFGHSLHLLLDTAQPAHARDDGHPLDLFLGSRPLVGGFGRIVQYCVGATTGILLTTPTEPYDIPPLPTGPDSIVELFDTDGGGIGSGLAELSG